ENATRICQAKFGMLVLTKGAKFRMAAMHGAPPAWVEKRTREPVFAPGPSNNLVLATQSKKTQHVADLRLHQSYVEREPAAVALAEIAGARTLAVVPMIKDNEPIGAIAIYRTEVRPFSDKQIELVTNFAAQAVIAVGNTRLLNELRESLQQQSATADVLKVISSSPGKLEPVFDAMLANATRICEATYGAMWLRQDGKLRNVAFYGTLPAAFSQLWKAGSEISSDSDVPVARAVRSGKPVIVPDLKDDVGYREGHPLAVGAVDLGGIRTLIAV